MKRQRMSPNDNFLEKGAGKMVKKTVGLSAAAVLYSASILNSAAAAVQSYETLAVKIDGENQTFSQPSIVYHDITLVPMRDIFEALGAEVTWDEKQKKITAVKGDSTVELKMDATEAFKNNEMITLMVAPSLMNGKTMVPLRFVSEALEAEVSYENSSKLIEIFTTKSDKKVQDDSSEKEQNGASVYPLLTIEDAVAKAQADNLSIRQAQLSIKQNEEEQEQAQEELEYIPIGTGNGEEDQAIRNSYTSTQKAYINLRSSEKQLEVEKESVEYNVKEAYYDIIQAEKNLKIAELTLEQAETEKDIIQEKEKVGKASGADVTDALKKWQEAQTDLQTKKQNVSDAYEALNQLMGNTLNKRYTLEYDLQFEKLEDDDVDYQVARLLSDSTSVWLAEQNINLAELSLNNFVFNVGKSYRSQELEVDKAEFELAGTKQQLEMKIRSVYSTIKQLENQYAAFEASLQKGKETQEIIKTKYEYGLATALELEQANLDVKKMEQQLFTTLVQHELAKIVYEKPWV